VATLLRAFLRLPRFDSRSGVVSFHEKEVDDERYTRDPVQFFHQHTW